MAAIHDHRNAERALFSIGLGNVHAPDRQRVPGRTRAMHPHRYVHPGLGGQGNLAINPSRPGSSVASINAHSPSLNSRRATSGFYQSGTIQRTETEPITTPDTP